MRRSRHLLPLALALALVALLAACSDDDPTCPGSSATIVVDTAPDSLAAPWILTGPDGFELAWSGDRTLTDMPPGWYWITWPRVSGWTRPVGADTTLEAGGTITFSGEYTPNSVLAQTFVAIPPVTVSVPVVFTMGSDVEGDNGNSFDETPHQVRLTRGFLMATTEVTNGQFIDALQWAYEQGHVTVNPDEVLDNLDGSSDQLLEYGYSAFGIRFEEGAFYTDYPNLPAAYVSWRGAAAYCDWLSLREGLPRAYDHAAWLCNGHDPYGAAGYRLPTEAEWELACRAGTATYFNTGDCLDSATEANYNGQYPYDGCAVGPSVGQWTDVGIYPANAWGLFDMHGNVKEYCNDGFPTAYTGDVTDPVGDDGDAWRTVRGGSFLTYATNCRSAYRDMAMQHSGSDNIGFRPVRTIVPE